MADGAGSSRRARGYGAKRKTPPAGGVGRGFHRDDRGDRGERGDRGRFASELVETEGNSAVMGSPYFQ